MSKLKNQLELNELELKQLEVDTINTYYEITESVEMEKLFSSFSDMTLFFSKPNKPETAFSFYDKVPSNLNIHYKGFVYRTHLVIDYNGDTISCEFGELKRQYPDLENRYVSLGRLIDGNKQSEDMTTIRNWYYVMDALDVVFRSKPIKQLLWVMNTAFERNQYLSVQNMVLNEELNYENA